MDVGCPEQGHYLGRGSPLWQRTIFVIPQLNTPSSWGKERIITKERAEHTTASTSLMPRASPAFLGSYSLAQTSVNNPLIMLPLAKPFEEASVLIQIPD